MRTVEAKVIFLLRDLYNLTEDHLEVIAELMGIELNAKDTKDKQMRAIWDVGQNQRYTLFNHARPYLYTRRGAISLFKLNISANIQAKKLSKEKLIGIREIKRASEKELRPEVTDEPSLNRVIWVDSDKAILEFVELGKQYTPVSYDISPTRPLQFTKCTLNLSRDILQIQLNMPAAKKYSGIVSQILSLAYPLDAIHIPFTFKDYEEIRRRLGGITDGVIGKSKGGPEPYDTKKVTRSPVVEDLESHPKFQEDFSDYNRLTNTLKYKSKIKNAGVPVVKVQFNTQNGHVIFTKQYHEAVIDELFSTICEIKGL